MPGGESQIHPVEVLGMPVVPPNLPEIRRVVALEDGHVVRDEVGGAYHREYW